MNKLLFAGGGGVAADGSFEGAKYVCSSPLRDPSNRPALWNVVERSFTAPDLAVRA